MAIRVCVAQISSILCDVAANLAKMTIVVAEQAKACDVVVFPELFLIGYPTSYGEAQLAATRDLCEIADGPSFQAVASLARTHGVAIVYGYGELDAGER